jgi:methylphosphotriester-DNA--protein-cysteine methyltransferase
MISAIFKSQDNPVGHSAGCSRCQAASAEENITSRDDGEKIEDGEDGLTAAAVIDEYAYEKNVYKYLNISKSGVTPDEFQNQRRTDGVDVYTCNESNHIIKGRDNNVLFSGLQHKVYAQEQC